MATSASDDRSPRSVRDTVEATWLNMRRMNTCWREMRPRSPVGSSCHTPSSMYWRWRDRAKASAAVPSRVTHPGSVMLSPELVARMARSKYMGTPPTVSTMPLNPWKSTSA